MPVRFLFIVGQLRAGGMERQLVYLLENLDREASSPGLLVWSYRQNDFHADRVRNLGIPVYGFEPALPGAMKLLRLHRLVSQLCPAVVHSYSFYTNFAAWLGTRGTHALAVGSLRADFESEIKSSGALLGRLSAFLPKTMISNNQAAATRASKSAFFKPTHVRVVRNGLDMTVFNPRSELPREPTILGIGSLVTRKRWDRLIRALSMISRKGRFVRLRLVGDGDQRAPLNGLVCKLGLADRVEFLGTRGDVPELLASCTLLAHASETEGCPNAVMEAMASARPVVATDAGDVSELVEDGRTGYVVRRGDDDLFAMRLDTLIASPNLCRSMGQAGRMRAEKRFGLKRLVEETQAAYHGFCMVQT